MKTIEQELVALQAEGQAKMAEWRAKGGAEGNEDLVFAGELIQRMDAVKRRSKERQEYMRKMGVMPKP
jgi:hypothetical protein